MPGTHDRAAVAASRVADRVIKLTQCEGRHAFFLADGTTVWKYGTQMVHVLQSFCCLGPLRSCNCTLPSSTACYRNVALKLLTSYSHEQQYHEQSQYVSGLTTEVAGAAGHEDRG